MRASLATIQFSPFDFALLIHLWRLDKREFFEEGGGGKESDLAYMALRLGNVGSPQSTLPFGIHEVRKEGRIASLFQNHIRGYF